MRKLLNNRWFVVALAAAAIVFVWVSLMPANAVHRSAAAAIEPTIAAEEQTAAEAPTGEAAPLSTTDALKQLSIPKTARDPFTSGAPGGPATATAEPEEPDLVDTAHLSGLWTQNGATLVFINEHIHSVGDTIGRFKIESASQDGVWLTHWKGRTFLALGKSFVLKTPARQPGNISSQ